jgi:hypothetical protein
MTASLLTRSAVTAAVTGAVLLAGLTGAGAASATSDDGPGAGKPAANEKQVLKRPSLTDPHGRKIG